MASSPDSRPWRPRLEASWPELWNQLRLPWSGGMVIDPSWCPKCRRGARRTVKALTSASASYLFLGPVQSARGDDSESGEFEDNPSAADFDAWHGLDTGPATERFVVRRVLLGRRDSGHGDPAEEASSLHGASTSPQLGTAGAEHRWRRCVNQLHGCAGCAVG